MAKVTMKTKSEVENMLDDVLDQQMKEDGGSKWPGMTYEEGVEAALRWVLGDGDNPLSD